MPVHVKKALDKFQHNKPKKAQNQPYPHEPVQYGEKIQYAKGEDTSNKLERKDAKLIQEATGNFIYPDVAVDSPWLTPLR